MATDWKIEQGPGARAQTLLNSEKEWAADPELEDEVVALAQREGTLVAIQRYRQATCASGKRSRAAVEEILFRHGVFSMTQRTFRNWQRHLLVAVVGLLVALLLILLWRLI